MDIKSFYLDYEMLFEILIVIVVFSFFIERALAVIYESRWFINLYKDEKKRKGLKEFLAVVVSIAVCTYWKLDALTVISSAHANMTVPGYILTGMVVAGGSKASIALFKDLLGFMSTAEAERKAIEEAEKEIRINEIKR